MDHSAPVLIWVAFLVIAVAVWIASSVMARKRTLAWQQVATHLGLQFSSQDPFNLALTESLPLFGHGHSRRAYNVMYGDYQGFSIKCFDYRYTVGSGKNSHTYNYTCLLVPSNIEFVTLAIRPESLIDKIGHLVGVEDIQFESDEFNRKYKITCADQRFAFDVIHPRVIDMLLSAEPMAIEACAHSVLFYYPYGRARMSALETTITGLMQFGMQFIGLLPQYLSEHPASADQRQSPAIRPE